MRHHILLSLLLGLIALSLTADGRPPANPDAAAPAEPAIPDRLVTEADLRQLTEHALAKLQSGDVSGAVGLLRPHLLTSAESLDKFALMTTQQRTIILPLYGEPRGAELIRTEKVGESLLRMTYLEKFKNHGFRWYFVFYKTSDDWGLSTFYFDDKIHELFGPTTSNIGPIAPTTRQGP